MEIFSVSATTTRRRQENRLLQSAVERRAFLRILEE
jgi:hypothetical protein